VYNVRPHHLGGERFLLKIKGLLESTLYDIADFEEVSVEFWNGS